ncbi:nicotinate phosphoribosyltransferase [Streptomonospora wellingtoniae]|uniref:Nicotinate phosphoribosyltransferase n=1 Tax=Streptomonospora wellingtoniae TaxID=3075544 RepID=A0ABU2KR57_9ACTN|nr:nicotinate phosphoribosyltransferase [Streptomonospora sp. DSM 45055]MDT0301760.1 nicotinate phosphoribosyltransferase [Streptomonospora sp. DSM 45055]
MTDDASSALLTDRYELTMLQGALHSGAANRRTVFEMFARRLPENRGYGVVAGTGRFLDALERFRFDSAALDYLAGAGGLDDTTLSWLADYRFSGDVWGYGEGEAYFPGSPILVVEGTFAESVLLETVALSIYNHDSAIASAASRMSLAAGDRPMIEMGSRRTHEMSAVAAARAAYMTGFSSTSNLEAGRRFGVPTAGTSAHSFVLVHDTEREAFEAQLRALGGDTTLLVDTYDVEEAVRTAVELGGSGLGGVRVDSGDLSSAAFRVRRQLDDLGAPKSRVIVTGDLDEHAIQALAVAPVDGYGVGTALVTGSGAPTASLVYKLVARSEHGTGELEPVAKRSVGKPSKGGRKWASRRLDESGVAAAEIVHGKEPQGDPRLRPLLRRLVADGEVVGREPIDEARERHSRSIAELPETVHRMHRAEPVIATRFEQPELA